MIRYLSLVLLLLCFNSHASTFIPYQEVTPLKAAYFGELDVFYERIDLDENIELYPHPSNNTLAQFDTAIIYNSELEAEQLSTLKPLIKSGDLGLVVNLGSNISSVFLSELLETNVNIRHIKSDEKNVIHADFGEVIKWTGPSDHLLFQSIAWKSAPKVHDISHIDFTSHANYKTLVSTQVENSKLSIPILTEFYLGKGKIYIVSPWIKKGNDHERLDYFWSVVTIPNKDAYNYTFYNWSYFNWLQHALVYLSTDSDFSKFSQWAYSPVPHTKHKIVLSVGITFILIFSFFSFYWVRKHSLKEQNILTTIRRPDDENFGILRIKSIKNKLNTKKGFSLLISKAHYRFANILYSNLNKSSEQWEEVGFIRPLAGFQMVVAAIYLGIIPILIFATLLLNYILPFPQSIGMTSWVNGAFSLLFTIFDLGTGIAMVKYFSEYRVKDPAKAMQFVQFYIWFQLLSGIIQVSILTITALQLAPESAYAFLTWMILFKILIQFPGFAPVFHNIFRALQRFDLMILTWILPIPFSAIFSLIAMFYIRSWGLANPVYGEIMGLSLGEIVPAFIASWIFIIVSAFIYRALGFSLKATFSAHFTLDVVKKSLSFGLRYTPGAIAPMISGFALPIILSFSLNNYLELSSLLIAALWINFLIRGPGYMLYSNLLPSISEAYSHGKIVLSSHYIDQALKWSLMFVGGILPYFIILGENVAQIIMPPQWAAASQFIALAIIFGTIEFLGALPDETYKAVGKPQIFTFINMSDHILRVILMIILVPEFKVYGVLYAFIIAVSLRCVISWFILAKFILPLKISWWQSIVTPVIVSLLIFILAAAIKFFYSPNSSFEAILLIGVFLILSPIVYFLSALLGGFDDDTINEFERATDINILTRLMRWIPLIPTRFGSRISPLHGKFPLRNWDEAQQEAKDLTAEKVEF
jgi:O-antigen/teichoic acid export membrane protein